MSDIPKEVVQKTVDLLMPDNTASTRQDTFEKYLNESLNSSDSRVIEGTARALHSRDTQLTTLRTQLTSVEKERDDLSKAVDGLIAQKAEIGDELVKVREERDALAIEVEELKSELKKWEKYGSYKPAGDILKPLIDARIESLKQGK